MLYVGFLHYFLKDFIYLFNLFILPQRGREGEREGEKHQCVLASHVPLPLLGTWPATQACALAGKRTRNPSVCRPALSALSHISQGFLSHINKPLIM